MKTVSYSLDDDIVEGIAEMAQKYRTSKSDVIRNMYIRYELSQALAKTHAMAAPHLEKLGIHTEQDLADYLYSLKQKHAR